MVIALWGINWPIMKVGVAAISPLWFGVLRLAIGAGVLFGVLLISRRLAWPQRRDLPVVVSVGLLQMAAFLALVNVALLHVGAGRSAILAYTTPLWVVPGAILFLGERPTWPKLAGLLLGLGGVAALFSPTAVDWSDSNVMFGNLLLMIAAVGWAIAILHVRGHDWQLTPLQLAPWQLLVGLPPLVALATWHEGAPVIEWSGPVAAIVVYNGALATALCYWATVTVTRALPAVTTSLSLLCVPVVGLLSSTLSLGEPLGLPLLAGCGLILGGVALVNLADQIRR
jgi:drug/metabolite transporter (DMT)-like permease